MKSSLLPVYPGMSRADPSSQGPAAGIASSAAKLPRAVSTVVGRVPSGSSREVGVDMSGLCGRLMTQFAAAAGAAPARAGRGGAGRGVVGRLGRRGLRSAGATGGPVVGLPAPRAAARTGGLGPGLAGFPEILFHLGGEPGPGAAELAGQGAGDARRDRQIGEQ